MNPNPLFNFMNNTSGALPAPPIGQISSGSGATGMTMMAPTSSGLAGLAGSQLIPSNANPMMGGMGGLGMGANGGGWFQKIGGMEGLGTIAQGIASLGSVLGSMKGLKLAKEQLAFEKDTYNTNLTNTKKTYNTNLEDRVRARYATEGRSGDEVSSYLAKHSM